MVKHSRYQYAQADDIGAAITGDEEQGQELCLIANFGDGNGKGRTEEGFHEKFQRDTKTRGTAAVPHGQQQYLRSHQSSALSEDAVAMHAVQVC